MKRIILFLTAVTAFVSLASAQDGSLCFSLSNVNHAEYRKIGSVISSRKDSPIHKIVASGRYNLINEHLNQKVPYPGFMGSNRPTATSDSRLTMPSR